MRKIGTAALVITVAVTLTACTAQEPTPTPTPTPTPSSSGPTFPDAAPFSPAPSGAIDEDSGEVIEPQPVPEWDDNSRAAAIAAAETALRAYARPNMSADAWREGLTPLLDQKAQQDYSYIEPARIVASEVTGPGTITDDTSAYVAFVDVPTNAGTYGVVVSRVDADAAWLTSRFILPEGVN